MNNKLPDDNLFRKKSFFVALYSCVGVVLIMAAVMSYMNINQAKRQAEPENNISAQLDETMAGLQTPNPALLPSSDDEMIARAQEEARRRAEESQRAAAEAIAKAKATAAPSPAPAATEAPSPSPEVEQEKASEPDKALAAPMFNAFSEGDRMDWPVAGEVVMEYSLDHVTYDKTLDQYRTNDNIWISAKPGEPVRASSEGVVLKVEKTHKDGTTVTVDNGNGWTTTYGQLLDSVIVNEGEIVKRGQIIGGVANPTIYGVLQGPHVSFSVEKDNASVDPISVLEAAESAEENN